jgi:hypothetical protein
MKAERAEKGTDLFVAVSARRSAAKIVGRHKFLF